MWLVDHHQIAVDDPVSKYITAFDTAEKNKITIRHLLTHTSGLMEWYPLYYRASNRKSLCPDCRIAPAGLRWETTQIQ